MSKNIYVKLTLTFFLSFIPVYVTSCQQQKTNTTGELSQQKYDTLAKLINAIYDVDYLINNNLITDIQEIKNVNNKPKLNNSIQDTNNQIIEKIDNIKKNSQVIGNNKSGKSTLNLINDRLENIKNISLFFKKNEPFEENNIIQLQKYLNQNLDNSKNSKVFNDKIKENIINSLQRDTTLLKLYSNQLIDIDRNDYPNNPNSSIEKLTNQINYFRYFAAIVSILSVIAFLLSMQSLLEKRGRSVISKEQTLDGNNQDEVYGRLYHKLYQSFSSVVSKLEERIQELEKISRVSPSKSRSISVLKQPPAIKVNSSPDIYTSPFSSPPSSNQSLSPTTPIHKSHSSYTPNFLQTYNDNPSLFSSDAVEVNLTEESIEQRRLGSGEEAVIEHKSGGSYWILKEDNFDYLVPKGNLIFNQHRYNTAQALFKCQGYESSCKQKFHVTQPAKVIRLSGDKWRLEEKGILEFYSQ